MLLLEPHEIHKYHILEKERMPLLVPIIVHPRSCSSIGYNEDLLADILLYLPVKSILRFKSVSKQWHNLLSAPKFIQRHASRQTTNSVLLFLHLNGIKSLYLKGNNHSHDTVGFGFLQNSHQDSLFVIKSCNGLLLVESNNFEVKEQFRRRRFYVCNPFTRKHSELAVPDYIATLSSVFFNLAFDPSISPHYKVVFCWSDDMISCDYHIAIYSSETRTCRKLGYTFESRFSWLCSGVFLNGVIHWINPSKKTSFYFDINQESIKVYPMPPCSGLGTGCMYFGKCQGHLNLILGDVQELCQCVLDVYELKEDYSSWFVKYKIDFDVIAVGFPEIIITENHNSEKRYEYSFLCLLEDEEQEPTIVLSVANQLLAYNFIDKTTKKLCDVPFRGDDTEGSSNFGFEYFRSFWWYEAFHCIENLFGV